MDWGEVEGGDEGGEVKGVEVPVVVVVFFDVLVWPGEASGVVYDVEVRGQEGLDVVEASKVRQVAMRENECGCIGGACAAFEVV